MSDSANVLRIYQNIQFLLDEGWFPGGMSIALNEAQAMVDNIIKEIQRQQEPINEQQQDTAQGE